MKPSKLTFNSPEMRVKLTLLFLLILVLTIESCRKFIEIDAPSTSTNAEIVFNDDATASSVMTGIYSRMNTGFLSSGGTVLTLSLFPELSSDNLTLFSLVHVRYPAYYKNELTPLYTGMQGTFWSVFYPLIYTCNAVVEGVEESKSLTPGVASRLNGEASFMRAFLYFYLVNLYGEVPLVISTDYKKNEGGARSSKTEIYSQIISDLKNAVNRLDDQYMDASLKNTTAERIRPNKFTAIALLSRAYLYAEDFSNAEIEASKVIDNKSLYDTVALNEVFLKNNKESIWSLQPIANGRNTEEAVFYLLPTAGPTSTRPAYLSTNLINSFEPDDQRLANWVQKRTASNGTVYPCAAKYKVNTLNAPVTEYPIVFRLAEQYLIRAEARVQLNKLSEGQADLNVIRKRARLPNTTAITQAQLKDAILAERRLEYFTEWGHRWFDMKRSGKIDELMQQAAISKGSTWKPEWQLYPVPQGERERNINLSQNPGY